MLRLTFCKNFLKVRVTAVCVRRHTGKDKVYLVHWRRTVELRYSVRNFAVRGQLGEGSPGKYRVGLRTGLAAAAESSSGRRPLCNPNLGSRPVGGSRGLFGGSPCESRNTDVQNFTGSSEWACQIRSCCHLVMFYPGSTWDKQYRQPLRLKDSFSLEVLRLFLYYC